VSGTLLVRPRAVAEGRWRAASRTLCGVMFIALEVALALAALTLLLWALSRFQLVVRIPFDGAVAVEAPVSLDLVVPLDTVLTERELDLSQLVIPIDTQVLVDEQIELNATLPVETQVATPLGITVPIKAQVALRTSIPLRQRVRVKEDVRLSVRELAIPLRMDLPVKLSFVLAQRVHLKTDVDVPLHVGMLRPLRLERRKLS
jgi:hypothetical protein